MSAKEQKREKVRIDYASKQEFLDLLDFPSLMKDWQRAREEATKWMAQESVMRASIAQVVKATGVDTVVYPDENGKIWNATYVAATPVKKLNKKKLATNMGKIGKLDAKTVQRIFEESTTKEPRMGYGRISTQDEDKKYEESNDSDE